MAQAVVILVIALFVLIAPMGFDPEHSHVALNVVGVALLLVGAGLLLIEIIQSPPRR